MGIDTDAAALALYAAHDSVTSTTLVVDVTSEAITTAIKVPYFAIETNPPLPAGGDAILRLPQHRSLSRF